MTVRQRMSLPIYHPFAFSGMRKKKHLWVEEGNLAQIHKFHMSIHDDLHFWHKCAQNHE